MSELSQYKDLYLQTSREYLQALNNSLLLLEKDQHDQTAIDEIFRSAHSLKSQSAAMGYEKTGFLCHTVEDIFYEIKQGRLELTPELADILFKAFDDLTHSIDSIESNDTETDLTNHVKILKQQTGVTTTGAGKSVRHNQPSPDTGQPEHLTKQTQSTPPVPDDAGTQSAPETAAQPVSSSPTPTPAATSSQAEQQTSQKVKTITLPVEQLDAIMDIVEEITIQRLQIHNSLTQFAPPEVMDRYDTTTKLMQSLQYEVMKTRLIPVSVVFDHFPRAVRDLARAENKQVELIIADDHLAIDRAIVERLDEPIIHLLRNAVSHGIDKSGTIIITTEKEREWALITIHDDGQGIDWDKLRTASHQAGGNPEIPQTDLLFSGLSTAEAVTNISGRGVGMKAVKETIESFGGKIEVQSVRGEGSAFILKFPLSLAISKVLIIKVGQTRYALPTISIERIITLPLTELRSSAHQEVFVLGKTEVPLIRLDQKLGLSTEDPPEAPDAATKPSELLVVIARINEELVGLLIDQLISTLDIVVKPLPPALKGNRLFNGTTILESGQTALIINLPALV